MVYTTPEKVAEGLRDYIAYECTAVAKVTVVPAPVGRGYQVCVTMDPTRATPTKDAFARDLADMLPKGFSLLMHWTTPDA